MATKQVQEQKQEQVQKLAQSFSQQQLLQASLIELPVAQLIDRINTEMNDNPALDPYNTADANVGNDDFQESADDLSHEDDFAVSNEREERQTALDEALSNIGRDDEELPVYHGGRINYEEREEVVYGTQVSFYDQLKEQMGEIELDERQEQIMEYLIGSLDDDGLLRKSLISIEDELAIYHNVDVTSDEIEAMLLRLQDFDTAGIGARSLQECLLLQIERKDDSVLKTLMHTVISDYFEEFTKKHWDKIRIALGLNELQVEALSKELRRLNPRPGASMGESVGRSMQQITPDFIVESNDDGTISFQLNNSEVPELHVSQSFVDTLKEYQDNRANMSRQMKEALLYTRKKVESARSFIEAIKVRRRTLTITMQAIINWQHRFFEEGDEALLRPMILKDIATKTGLDISTVSRVSNSKFAQTRWGTFPLRYFFSDAFVTESGEELSTRQIKAELRDIVEAENKKRPLSDDAIREELEARGFPIARRTVAKYREQLGIPIARLRRQ